VDRMSRPVRERGGGSVLQGSPDRGCPQSRVDVATISTRILRLPRVAWRLGDSYRSASDKQMPPPRHTGVPTLCDHAGTGAAKRCGGEQNMSSGINGIADDFEKQPLQSLAPAPAVDMVALETVLMEPLEESPAPAPIVDMVALKAVLMEPLEEPRAGLDKLAALLKALPYAQMLALGASIWAANTPRTRLTQEILPEVLYRWALTRVPGAKALRSARMPAGARPESR
jgi:hypothetical protein